jgi:hypothetical protein
VNLLAFLLLLMLVLSAIAAPVVFALRRRARFTALLAGSIGFGVQALYVTYLQSGALGPEQGALALLLGVPGLALLTCLVLIIAIKRNTAQKT